MHFSAENEVAALRSLSPPSTHSSASCFNSYRHPFTQAVFKVTVGIVTQRLECYWNCSQSSEYKSDPGRSESRWKPSSYSASTPNCACTVSDFGNALCAHVWHPLPLPPIFFGNSSQEDVWGLINSFRQIDIEEKGSVPRQDVVKALQDSKEASYDQVRETLKEVSLDSSGRVELEDYVDVGIQQRHLSAHSD